MAENLEFNSGDRDQVVKRLIKHDNSHVSDPISEFRQFKYWSEQQFKTVHPDREYVYWSEFNRNSINNTGISFVVAPSWGILFPPYSLARLTGLLRHYGYNVRNYDVNVECWHYVKSKQERDWWDSIYFYSWEDPVYSSEIHPVIKPILDKAVLDIVNSNHTLIGFSLYQSNIMASMYMISEVKRLKPESRIIVGGPEAFNSWMLEKMEKEWKFDTSQIDFIIQGEGEQELLKLLENYEEFPLRNEPYIFGGFQSRLDLDSLPFPDYDDFNFSLYEYPNGVSIETSRGCVAKCSFCAETHFWKFRYHKAPRVIEEMKSQISRYGVNRFWFVDSLVNGAFTEFKRLVEGIIDNNLDIHWNSYARNDGRMDLEFFRKIVQSGCTVLSFGVESGSQRVLDDMQKKVKVWEIESNLRDGREVGMTNHCNWIVGFPTEGKEEFLHSLELLYNVRKDMYAISPGYTCGDAPFSDMQKNWRKYKISWIDQPGDMKFLSKWYTDDYENTILHRYIRLKLTNVWLNFITTQSDGTVINTQSRPDLMSSVSIKWNSPKKFVERIEQGSHNFDYWSAESITDKLSAGLANEYLPFLWVTYKTMGGYEFEIDINPGADMDGFGTFVVNDYWGNCKAKVNDNGDCEIIITHHFNHVSLTGDNDVANVEVPRLNLTFPEQTFIFKGNIDKFFSPL